MIVCICRQVSECEIRRHAHCGLDFDDIQSELGVALHCGACEGCARALVAQCRNQRAPCLACRNAAPSPCEEPALQAA